MYPCALTFSAVIINNHPGYNFVCVTATSGMDQVYYMCTILLHRHLSALTAHDLHDFCIVIGVNTRVMMFFFVCVAVARYRAASRMRTPLNYIFAPEHRTSLTRFLCALKRPRAVCCEYTYICVLGTYSLVIKHQSPAGSRIFSFTVVRKTDQSQPTEARTSAELCKMRAGVSP